VILFCNASQTVFADNTTASFTIRLTQTLDLGPTGKWEVGLCEVTRPTQYGQFTHVGDINVYCNLISPQFLGSQLVRCLTFILLAHRSHLTAQQLIAAAI
jgi:hypothetical protein